MPGPVNPRALDCTRALFNVAKQDHRYLLGSWGVVFGELSAATQRHIKGIDAEEIIY